MDYREELEKLERRKAMFEELLAKEEMPTLIVTSDCDSADGVREENRGDPSYLMVSSLCKLYQVADITFRHVILEGVCISELSKETVRLLRSMCYGYNPPTNNKEEK